MVRKQLWNFLSPCGMLGFSGQSSACLPLIFPTKKNFIQTKSLQMLFLAIVAPLLKFYIK